MTATDPTPTPPSPADPVGRFLATNRTTVGGALVAIGLACLIGGVFCFTKAASKPNPDAATTEKTDPLTGDKATGGLGNPDATEYIRTGALAVFAALAGFATGGFALGRPTDPADPKAARELRWVVAAAGGAFGLAIAALGLALFLAWFPVLTEWVQQKSSRGAWKVLLALLLFVLGGGLVLASVQLLRADERNWQGVRRVVFGTTLGVTALLLVVGLVAVNVLVGIAAPGALDTTSDPDIRLAPETTEYVAGMTGTVTAYATLTEQAVARGRGSQTAANLRRLLEQMQAANPERFRYVPLSVALDRDRIDALVKEFPAVFSTSSLGLLLVSEDRRAKFVPANLLDREYQTPQGEATGQHYFNGERVVVQQLLQFAGDTDRVVYVTQGHGEIAVPDAANPPAAGRPDRAGNRLVQALGADVTVKPLTFGLTAVKVPDDAAVVVVADPRQTFPKQDADALQAYMTTPRANGKKGKLLVLAGPNPNLDGKGMLDTGLAPVLEPLGLGLGDRYLVGVAYKADKIDFTDMPVVVNPQWRGQPPSVARILASREPILRRCREVSIADGKSAAPLLLAYAPGRVTWQDPNPPTDPQKVIDALKGGDEKAAQAMADRMQASRDVAYVVAAVATEREKAGEVARALVVGSGAFADADEAVPGHPPPEVVVAAGMIWLRDRPPVANVAATPKDEYALRSDADQGKMLFLPTLGLGIAVVALGLGVWVFRRK